MNLLIHAADENAEFVMDGHAISIPPNVIYEVDDIVGTDHNNNGPQEYVIPSKVVAAELVRMCWAYGLVEVPVVKSKGKHGPKYDYDESAAYDLAKQQLKRAEEQIVANYVTIQRERMSQNLPALPPNGRAATVIAKYRIDLDRDYGIKPVGGIISTATGRDTQIEELRQALATQEARFSRMIASMEAQVQQNAKPANSSGIPQRPDPKPGDPKI